MCSKPNGLRTSLQGWRCKLGKRMAGVPKGRRGGTVGVGWGGVGEVVVGRWHSLEHRVRTH